MRATLAEGCFVLRAVYLTGACPTGGFLNVVGTAVCLGASGRYVVQCGLARGFEGFFTAGKPLQAKRPLKPLYQIWFQPACLM